LLLPLPKIPLLCPTAWKSQKKCNLFARLTIAPVDPGVDTILNYATNDPLSNSIVITPEVLSALYTIASSSVLLVAFISMTDVG
jgi:hypothetical protein